jgi:hypothetical protein
MRYLVVNSFEKVSHAVEDRQSGSLDHKGSWKYWEQSRNERKLEYHGRDPSHHSRSEPTTTHDKKPNEAISTTRWTLGHGWPRTDGNAHPLAHERWTCVELAVNKVSLAYSGSFPPFK